MPDLGASFVLIEQPQARHPARNLERRITETSTRRKRPHREAHVQRGREVLVKASTETVPPTLLGKVAKFDNRIKAQGTHHKGVQVSGVAARSCISCSHHGKRM